jgi:hypothetical protein
LLGQASSNNARKGVKWFARIHASTCVCVEDPTSEHWIYDWQALSKFSNARASLIVEAVSLLARAGVEQQCARGREMVCLKPAS